MGDFLLAKKHFEIATSLYDRERHHQLTLRYSGVDLGIGARSYLALTLWNLGYPDQSLERSNEALALAQGLSDRFGLQFAEFFAGQVGNLT